MPTGTACLVPIVQRLTDRKKRQITSSSILLLESSISAPYSSRFPAAMLRPRSTQPNACVPSQTDIHIIMQNRCFLSFPRVRRHVCRPDCSPEKQKKKKMELWHEERFENPQTRIPGEGSSNSKHPITLSPAHRPLREAQQPFGRPAPQRTGRQALLIVGVPLLMRGRDDGHGRR